MNTKRRHLPLAIYLHVKPINTDSYFIYFLINIVTEPRAPSNRGSIIYMAIHMAVARVVVSKRCRVAALFGRLTPTIVRLPQMGTLAELVQN